MTSSRPASSKAAARRLKGEIESLAGGRVYTGQQALEVGLIDKIGGMADAMRFAADQANISKYDLRVIPAPKTIFDMFSEGMGVKDKDDDDTTTGESKASLFLRTPEMMSALQAIETIDPHGAANFRAALQQLQLFMRENVLMLDPMAGMLN